MKRKWVFNTILIALVVFLALPLFFDEGVAEQAVPNELAELDRKGQPLAFDHEGVADSVLPTLAGKKGQLPGKSANFMAKYAARVGSFYKKGLEVLTGGSSRAAGGGLYASSGSRASYFPVRGDTVAGDSVYGLNDGGDFASYYYGVADSSYSKSAGVGTTQAASSDAPIRGLYEVSLVDNNRFEAGQIYRRVMHRVDSLSPSVMLEKTAREYAPSKIPSAQLKGGAQDGLVASAPGGNSSGEYLGISSRPGSSSAQAGRYGAFGGSSARASEADSQGLNFGAFEAAASELKTDLQKVTGGSLGSGVAIGGGRQAEPGAKPGQSNQGNRPNPGQGPGTDNGQNPNTPKPPPGPTKEPVLYDPEAWPSNEPAKEVCELPGLFDSGQSGDQLDLGILSGLGGGLAKPPFQALDFLQPKQEEPKKEIPVGENVNSKYEEKDKIKESCGEVDNLPQLPQDVTGKYKSIIPNMGATKEGDVVVYAKDSVGYSILAATGLSPVAMQGKEGENTAVMPRSQYEKAAAGRDVIVLTVDPDENCRNCVHIGAGDPEYHPGYEQMLKDISHVVEKAAATQQQNVKNAQGQVVKETDLNKLKKD